MMLCPHTCETSPASTTLRARPYEQRSRLRSLFVSGLRCQLGWSCPGKEIVWKRWWEWLLWLYLPGRERARCNLVTRGLCALRPGSSSGARWQWHYRGYRQACCRLWSRLVPMKSAQTPVAYDRTLAKGPRVHGRSSMACSIRRWDMIIGGSFAAHLHGLWRCAKDRNSSERDCRGARSAFEDRRAVACRSMLPAYQVSA